MSRATEVHAPGVGPQVSAEHVEQRGLAGAVRAHQAEDLAAAVPTTDTPSSAIRPPKRTLTSIASIGAGAMLGGSTACSLAGAGSSTRCSVGRCSTGCDVAASTGRWSRKQALDHTIAEPEHDRRQAARQQQQDQHDREARREQGVLGAEQARDADDPQRTEHGAGDRRDPAEDRRDDQAQRLAGPEPSSPGCWRS